MSLSKQFICRPTNPRYSGQRRPQSAQSERAWVRGWCPFPHLEGGPLDAAVPAVLSLHPVIAVRHQAVLWVLFVFAHFSRQSVSVGVGGKLFILEKRARGGGRGNVSATSDASSETPERIVGRRGSWGGRINDDGGGEGRGENGSEENSCLPSLPFLPAPSPFGAVVSPLSLVSRPPHDLPLGLRASEGSQGGFEYFELSVGFSDLPTRADRFCPRL